MTSTPPRMGTHASYRILRLMRHECVQYMADRAHGELLPGSLSDSPDEDLNLLPYAARIDQPHLPGDASRFLSSPHVFVDTPIYEPDDSPFYVLLSRLDSGGTVADGRFVSLFSIPPCSPPLLVVLASPLQPPGPWRH